MQKTKTLTRKELYDLVWSKPLTQLAKEYAISDNGLRKTCIRNDIPLPKMGYWSKLKFNKKVKKTPFKENDEAATISLTIRREEDDNLYNAISELTQITTKIKNDKSLNLVVPEKLVKPALMIKEARKDLREQKPYNFGTYRNIISTSTNVISISVSPEMVRRALRFMDALVKLIKYRGHQIVLDRSTYFVINGEKIPVKCREIMKRVIVKENVWDTSYYIPSGVLSFRLDDFRGKEWRDGKIKLEEKLANILAKLELKSKEEKIARLERDKWHKEYQRKLDEEKKLKEQRELEIKEFKMLYSDAENWNKAEKIRCFLTEIESKLESETLNQKELKKWLKWANGELKSYDPISHGVCKMIKNYTLYKSIL